VAKNFVGGHTGTREAFSAVVDRPLVPAFFVLYAARTAVYFMDGDDAVRGASGFAGDGNYSPVVVGAFRRDWDCKAATLP
jgi:hypothetical protein